jgi:MoaA/NifB/PqqE/SkfB family radical SAM enzyme
MSNYLDRLPVLVISAHSRCNCRCGMCDIWRTPETQQFTLADLQRHFRDLQRLSVEWVVFTGGEALMNADLFAMAHLLRAAAIRVTILTSGLLLARYAREIAADADDVIVSLDGPPAIHDRIRGVAGAFEALAAGVAAVRAVAPRFPMAARCTVQKANHAALLDTALTARSLGLDSISFLAVNPGADAFRHPLETIGTRTRTLLPAPAEVDELEREIDRLAGDPVSAIVAESPQKLRRMVRYFRALAGGAEPDAPRCNAPWVSAVIEPDGSVRPCFFHPPIGSLRLESLSAVVNSEMAASFRDGLDIASNPVCRRCVCSLYRPVGQEAREAPALCE